MASRQNGGTTCCVDNDCKPILSRTDSQGHGVIRESPVQAEQYADMDTFLLWQTGEPGFSPGSSRQSSDRR